MLSDYIKTEKKREEIEEKLLVLKKDLKDNFILITVFMTLAVFMLFINGLILFPLILVCLFLLNSQIKNINKVNEKKRKIQEYLNKYNIKKEIMLLDMLKTESSILSLMKESESLTATLDYKYFQEIYKTKIEPFYLEKSKYKLIEKVLENKKNLSKIICD